MSTVPESDIVFGHSKEFWAILLTAVVVGSIPVAFGPTLMHVLASAVSAILVMVLGLYLDFLYSKRVLGTQNGGTDER